MKRSCKSRGFSLVELLLVLSIIGILAGIAVPSYLGQRRRARIIGDAQANASVLRMQLEQHKADAGLYYAASTALNCSWSVGNSPAASTSPAPGFTIGTGQSTMTLVLAIGTSGLTYTIQAKDKTLQNAVVYKTNQNGSNLYTMN